KEKNKDAEIIFIGTNRGLENDLVPRSGYKLKTIEAYGFSKSISITNFKNMIKTMKGFKQAKKIVDEFKPDIVIGTGGYICGAVITAAHKNNIPTLLHESNAYPGLAIRMLSKKVDTILVGFEDAKNKLNKAKNIVVTGTPTKMKGIKLTNGQKKQMRLDLNLKDDMPIILVFGGSQGARVINNTILDIVKNKRIVIFRLYGQQVQNNIK
ncbi:MAG: glycosyltransferase, partial [Clostridia bacterium]|nr:glycosyltransferase [Clostridia bacterium]